ncbi:MAG: hypothetical protein ACYDC5_11965 [Candidatus Dormibacteria bacterium]
MAAVFPGYARLHPPAEVVHLVVVGRCYRVNGSGHRSRRNLNDRDVARQPRGRAAAAVTGVGAAPHHLHIGASDQLPQRASEPQASGPVTQPLSTHAQLRRIFHNCQGGGEGKFRECGNVRGTDPYPTSYSPSHSAAYRTSYTSSHSAAYLTSILLTPLRRPGSIRRPSPLR